MLEIIRNADDNTYDCPNPNPVYASPTNPAVFVSIAKKSVSQRTMWKLNKGELNYVWPYYLPSTSTSASSFLELAITSILMQLRESDVLESCAGAMAKGLSLKHVQLDLFADEEGIPFTLSQNTAAGYLSFKYPTWVIEAISSISVSQLSPRHIHDLKSI